MNKKYIRKALKNVDLERMDNIWESLQGNVGELYVISNQFNELEEAIELSEDIHDSLKQCIRQMRRAAQDVVHAMTAIERAETHILTDIRDGLKKENKR